MLYDILNTSHSVNKLLYLDVPAGPYSALSPDDAVTGAQGTALALLLCSNYL